MTATRHVNKSTPCANCKHGYSDHCESGMPHFDTEDCRYSCIARHCLCGPCQCWAFVNPYTGAITPWKRPVVPETPCATCGHPRKHHCRKGQISIVVDDVPFICGHYMKSLQSDFRTEPCCDSTACAEVLDVEQQNFCTCPRFVSPYAGRRQKKRENAMTLSCFDPEDLARSRERYARNRPKTKAEILLEVVADFPDTSVRELADASGMSTSWVRKHLREAGITLAKPVRQSPIEAQPEEVHL